MRTTAPATGEFVSSKTMPEIELSICVGSAESIEEAGVELADWHPSVKRNNMKIGAVNTRFISSLAS